MTKLQIAKQIASTIVGIGTTKIVSAIIQNNITPDKVIDKVTVVGASVVIGSMAADATKTYTDAKIDEAVAWWKKTVSKTA